MRKIVAVVVAGLVLFCWGAVSHVVLPLGDAGMENVPESAAATFAGLPAQGMTEPGLFQFPPMTKEQMSDPAVAAAMVAEAPSGLIVYRPRAGITMGAATFSKEIATCLVLSALALFLLTCAAGCCTTLVSRVGFVATLGAVAAIARDVRHWTWFGYPTTFTVAQIVDAVIGMALVGLVLALIAKKSLDASCEGRG